MSNQSISLMSPLKLRISMAIALISLSSCSTIASTPGKWGAGLGAGTGRAAAGILSAINDEIDPAKALPVFGIWGALIGLGIGAIIHHNQTVDESGIVVRRPEPFVPGTARTDAVLQQHPVPRVEARPDVEDPEDYYRFQGPTW